MSKVLVVRFWLLAVLVLAWACWCLYLSHTRPDFLLWGLIPIGYFTGQANCFCCAPAPECSRCSGTVPAEYQVDVAGATNAGCSDCTLFNGTFVVEYTAELSGTCRWEFDLSPSICGANAVSVSHFAFFGAFTSVGIGIGGGLAGFQKTWAGFPIDCVFVAQDIPFGADDGVNCEFASATCMVTAL